MAEHFDLLIRRGTLASGSGATGRAGETEFAFSMAPTHVGYDGHPVPSPVAVVEEINQIADALIPGLVLRGGHA